MLVDAEKVPSFPSAGMSINLARFDLVSIHLVVLCAQRGSLAAAAKLAHMSKSTASQRLTSLECSFGRQLFNRDHRGLHLTEAGVVFAECSEAILHEIRRLGMQLASTEGEEPLPTDRKYGSRKR